MTTQSDNLSRLRDLAAKLDRNVPLAGMINPDAYICRYAADELAKLRKEVRIWECRAKRAADFLEGHGAAPDCAKSVLLGNYDYEFARPAEKDPAPLADEDGPGEEDGPWAQGWETRSGLGEPVKYCRCAFTDPDGTAVPGEACPIHTGDAR